MVKTFHFDSVWGAYGLFLKFSICAQLSCRPSPCSTWELCDMMNRNLQITFFFFKPLPWGQYLPRNRCMELKVSLAERLAQGICKRPSMGPKANI